MSAAKPTLGYPSRTDAVLALLAQGAIAETIGISVGCVAGLIASSRRRQPKELSQRAVARRVGTSIDIHMTLDGPVAETLLRHADRRKRLPVDVMCDIVDAVLGDDIVDAVLDDGESS